MASLYIEVDNGRKFAESMSFDNIHANDIFSALKDLRKKLGYPDDLNGKKIKSRKVYKNG